MAAPSAREKYAATTVNDNLVANHNHELMPRDGSLILSDVRDTTLTIVCEPCGRRGRYNVVRLMTEHGDPKLTDLLATLADCSKARSPSIHARCKAVYEGLRCGQD
jgi:hypothetical protein